MAPVGQMSRHARQVPQCGRAAASTGKGRSVNSSPRKNQEPLLASMRLVCFPIQPRPAFCARAFSSTGALSVKARKRGFQALAAASMRRPRRASRPARSKTRSQLPFERLLLALGTGQQQQ